MPSSTGERTEAVGKGHETPPSQSRRLPLELLVAIVDQVSSQFQRQMELVEQKYSDVTMLAAERRRHRSIWSDVHGSVRSLGEEPEAIAGGLLRWCRTRRLHHDASCRVSLAKSSGCDAVVLVS